MRRLDEVSVGTGGMGMDKTAQVGGRTSEGQAARAYGTVLQRGLWQR